MNHDHLFAFESDFVATLRCVPMAVRFKLDRTGIKLTLRQWSRFTPADRHELLTRSCGSAEEQIGYRDRLEVLVRSRTGDAAQPLPAPESPLWERLDGPPPAVAAFASSAGISPPTAEAWCNLAELQRFVLVKLSRDNHDNVNFIPALREFGCLADSEGAPADR
ncbi:MAG TPA: nitrate reductase associated protein [Caulobacteraceae bacterium]